MTSTTSCGRTSRPRNAAVSSTDPGATAGVAARALTADASFAALAGLGYGGFSGLFLGRAMALWQLARAPRTGVLRDA